MSPEEFKILNEKVVAGNASPEEILLFLKELNSTVSSLHNDLASLKNSQQ